MNDIRTPAASSAAQTAETVSQLADRTAAKADSAIQSTKRVTNDALDSLHHGVEGLRDTVPSAITRTAAQVEDLARRGIERAKATSANVRDQVVRTSDRTVDYIQEEPVKAMLIAAAAGAALVTAISWLSRSRRD